MVGMHRGISGRGFFLLAAVLFALGAGPARAQEQQAAGAQDDAPPKDALQVFGRVYARASADEREQFKRSLGVASARVGLEARVGRLAAEVSADLADKALLKDAYVRLALPGKWARVYAGQFKSPFLGRTLASSWGLPLVTRGLVQDYLADTHGLGGRRLGAMGELKLERLADLRVQAGLFQGRKDALGERGAEDAAVRVALSPWAPLTLAASGYLTQALGHARDGAGALEAAWEAGGLGLTLEGSAGRIAPGPFVAGTALASYTRRLGASQWALQPVVGAEVLRLTGGAGGQGHALVAGLNALMGEHFKALLQAERALRPGDEQPGVELALQLAARF